MHEPDFWTSSADAMDLTVEGNRLIAREIGDLAHGLLRRMGRSLGALLRGVGTHHQHLPPL